MADPTAATRPARPTIAQLREVTQPPAVRGRRNAEHWVADVYLRSISPYLTRLLLRTPLSPNGVTGLMILTGASAAFALLIPGLPGAVLAVLLGQLQMLWDCCDGEMARWKERYSPAGIFLDKVGHYTAEGLIPIALGIRAAGWPSQPLEPSWWPYLGALAAVLVLYNKALNDMVHVSRAFNQLPRLADEAGVSAPRAGGLRRIRSVARFVPFHRAYHSVEMTLLALVAAVVDSVAGDLVGTQVLVAALAGLGLLTVIGHIVAILSSSRLK
jgi:phosphatidylglycerophosphate synthase